MARSRNIKPSIMDNEELAELSPLTRLLFIYMWMLADRDGRIEDRPSRIKKQALGYDDGNADEMLTELFKAGFIDRYEVDGVKVIQVLNFAKHQTPHIREAASELPAKCQEPGKAGTSTNLGSASHDTSTNLGNVEASPRSPDSGFLIPDSLIPDTRVKRKRNPLAEPPDGVSEKTWQDFQRLRRQKRAPLTETALDGIRIEATRAGYSLEQALATCCLRGWQGFDADWVAGKQTSTDGLMAGVL